MSSFGVVPQDWRLVEVIAAIDRIHAGTPAEQCESDVLDFKEDRSRRDAKGDIHGGHAIDRAIALDLAEAAACLSNHRGGAVVVGVADRPGGAAAFRGTDLDGGWLRQRIHEITNPSLTVEVAEYNEPRSGQRLLVLTTPEALAAVAVGGEHRHRIGSQCVVMSAEDHASRHAQRRDWSAARSTHRVDAVDPAAIVAARAFLRATGVRDRAALAARADSDLLVALGAVDDGYLTEAGALMVGRRPSGDPARIDYRRRPAPGGTTQQRLNDPGLPLLVELERVFTALEAHGSMTSPVRLGTRSTIQQIPLSAAREAVVNGIMHRDWQSPESVEVEYAGALLTVTSPGGFLPGVTAANLLTTPARTRNAQLGRALRSLRLAESEGIGVDRMFRDMVQLGHRPPEITEVSGGRAVRCVLIGGQPVRPVVEVVSLLDETTQQDVDIALIVYALLQRPRTGAARLSPFLQKGLAQTEDAIQRGLAATVDLQVGSVPLIVQVGDVDSPRGWVRFGDAARRYLREALPYVGLGPRQAVRWVSALLEDKNEIRARDLVDLLDLSQIAASRALRYAQSESVVRLGSEQGVGRGVFYVRI